MSSATRGTLTLGAIAARNACRGSLAPVATAQRREVRAEARQTARTEAPSPRAEAERLFAALTSGSRNDTLERLRAEAQSAFA